MTENPDENGKAARARNLRVEGDEARMREAAAILGRVREETEPQVGAGSARLVTRTLDHLAARDADPADAIDVTGTRIGRLLALLAFVLLALSLASALVRG